MEKYKIGQEVTAIKDGVVINGTITEVVPEMEYEITDSLGNIRIVDHGCILGLGQLSKQAILFAIGEDILPF